MKVTVFAALAASVCFGQAVNKVAAEETATVLITSSASDSEVELDGEFVGSAPATLHISKGQHQLVVKKGKSIWQRNLEINAGSTVSIYAVPREPSGSAGV